MVVGVMSIYFVTTKDQKRVERSFLGTFKTFFLVSITHCTVLPSALRKVIKFLHDSGIGVTFV